jgi:hypothetical protein
MRGAKVKKREGGKVDRRELAEEREHGQVDGDTRRVRERKQTGTKQGETGVKQNQTKWVHLGNI